MKLHIRVDDVRTIAEFKEFRRELNANIKQGLTEGAERHALPKARAVAPSVVAPWLTVKATSTRPYLTTRGPRVYDRITGLLNWGGSPTSDILPKKAKALSTPWGPKAVVRRGPFQGKTPVYKPKLFLEEGSQAAVSGLEETLLDSVLDAFDNE